MPDRRTERKVVLTSQAVIAAKNSDAMFVRDYTEAIVFINMTAVSGTSPTLDPKVQVSDDGGTTWYTISRTWRQESGVDITQITDGTNDDANGTGTYSAQVTNIGRHIRVSMALPGGSSTPSFTMVITIEAKN